MGSSLTSRLLLESTGEVIVLHGAEPLNAQISFHLILSSTLQKVVNIAALFVVSHPALRRPPPAWFAVKHCSCVLMTFVTRLHGCRCQKVPLAAAQTRQYDNGADGARLGGDINCFFNRGGRNRLCHYILNPHRQAGQLYPPPP